MWERLALALSAKQAALAKYLIGLLPEPELHLGHLFYRAQFNPLQVTATKALRQSKRARQVLVHAHNRLVAKSELTAAHNLWSRYKHWKFSTEQVHDMATARLVGWAQLGEFPQDLTVFTNVSTAAQEKMLLAAVRAQAWDLVSAWSKLLPEALAVKTQWRYWAARAAQQSVQAGSQRAAPGSAASAPDATSAWSREVFEELALTRDYYGFLAAQHLGTRAVLNSDFHARDANAINQLRTRAEVERVLELYAVREFIAARREWVNLLPKLSQSEKGAAAHLAADIGWSRQAIEAANKAKLHDDTDLRFPVVHLAAYQRMSHATQVPLTLLLAVSRQESAFDERARSHADARGLMQLLPSTAKRIAKKVNLSQPTKTALYRPSTNIEIASHYLAFLLERFGGSRPLALAGYNAGEHRVDRWLAEAAAMPMDVWIERIPFYETRNYVKNVLAFSQVYNRKLALEEPLLQLNELQVPLLPQSQLRVVNRSDSSASAHSSVDKG